LNFIVYCSVAGPALPCDRSPPLYCCLTLRASATEVAVQYRRLYFRRDKQAFQRLITMTLYSVTVCAASQVIIIIIIMH
jgi:hypothetical protein